MSSIYFVLFVSVVSAHALPQPGNAGEKDDWPVMHNDKFDMIMPEASDHHHTAAAMNYQNFEAFYDPEMLDNMEYKMMESQFVNSLPRRSPQPLSREERRVRQTVENVDETRERQIVASLRKGSTQPKRGAAQWDQFDYDEYTNYPDNRRRQW